MFLINEAYAIYCETIEEYPSHSSELCHRANYEVNFLKQGRLGVQALPDNCFPETIENGPLIFTYISLSCVCMCM